MAKRKLECHADFERALRNGYGIGAGESYKPWIRVEDISSEGLSSKIPGIRINRLHHLLSGHEKHFFLFAESNPHIVDIREQFPLLPLSLALRIAEQAGIPYPTHPKTRKPIVETTDFLLSIQSPSGIRYLAVAVKPADELSLTRVREKLDLDRLWWSLLGVEWRLVTDNELNRTVADNLDWFSDPLRGTKRNELDDLPTDARQIVASTLAPGRYIWEALVDATAESLGRPRGLCARLLRVMAWEKIIDLDLSAPVQRTGIARIKRINADFAGERANEAAS